MAAGCICGRRGSCAQKWCIRQESGGPDGRNNKIGELFDEWENNRYASIPVLNRRGEYVGTLTEGDILWGLKKLHGLDLEAAEEVPISSFPHKRDYKAVTVTTSMDQLVEAAMNQNFVPAGHVHWHRPAAGHHSLLL